MGEDFKLNYLFNKYKDKNIFGLTRFKKMIKKENDDFIDIIMLFNKIMDYQHEKYGKWGALPFEVRECIYNLIEVEKSADYVIKSLQKRIDKAINFIKDTSCYDEKNNSCNDDLNYDEVLILLDILKGEDNE